MKYTCSKGCLFYYDRVLYDWKLCDTNMLFLLGFEASTTYDVSPTDCIQLSKYAYHSYSNELVPLTNFTIFDDIHNLLSELGTVYDFESYIKFSCYGLKLIMNELTGTGTDKTVPILFNNDINQSAVDSIYIDEVSPKDSLYDIQAKRIYAIFNDAEYDESFKKITYNKSLFDSEKSAVTSYNELLDNEYYGKSFNSQFYKLIDYKAMYSYSLGVLYGCRCLGYDDSLIWTTDPKFWYNGAYTNLISTAWKVFRFHWVYNIDDSELLSKYKSLQPNKLWNYDNVVDSTNRINNDDVLCYKLANYEQPEYTIYSKSRHFEDQELQLDDDSLVSRMVNPRGLILDNSIPVIRYLANNPIKMYLAYKPDNSNTYMSPSGNKMYYVTNDLFGWVGYSGGYISEDDSLIYDTNQCITFGQTKFSDLPTSLDNEYLINWAGVKQYRNLGKAPVSIDYSNLTIREDSTTSILIVLNEEPGAFDGADEEINYTVKISLSVSGEELEITANPEDGGIDAGDTITDMLFNSSNWNDPRRVTIKGASDNIHDGNNTAQLSFYIESNDVRYDGYVIEPLTIFIKDTAIVELSDIGNCYDYSSNAWVDANIFVGNDGARSSYGDVTNDYSLTSIVPYYKCKIGNRYMYAIFDGDVTLVSDDKYRYPSTLYFKEIVNPITFNKKYDYSTIPVIDEDGETPIGTFTLQTFYNINKVINLLANDSSHGETPMFWNGSSYKADVLSYGYTKTPSANVEGDYYKLINNKLTKIDIRNNSSLNKYWSSYHLYDINEFDSSLNPWVSSIPYNVYKYLFIRTLSKDSLRADVSIYSNDHTLYRDNLTSSMYIFNDQSEQVSEILKGLDYGFISLPELAEHGITISSTELS